MSGPMNCERCLECFASISEGQADAGMAEAVETHLRGCDTCRGAYEANRALEDSLRREARAVRAERIAAGLEVSSNVPSRAPASSGRRRRLRWLVGAGVLATAVLVALPLAWPGKASASAFAAAAERMRDAKALRVRIIETRSDGEQRRATLLISGTNRYRIEWEDGRVIVARAGEDRSLVLRTREKWATYGPQTPGDGLDLYDYLMSLGERSVQELGIEELDGRPCRKFIAREQGDGGRELLVYVDLESQRPVRVETTRIDTGNPMVAGVVEFDPELDDSLFSMEVPEGYAMRPATDDLQTAAVNVQIKLRNVAMGVMAFQQMNERFPTTLAELVAGGMLAPDAIVNPRTPGVEFAYRQPPPGIMTDPAADWGNVVLAYEVLPAGHAGGAVCFLDGHVDLLAHDDFERVVNGK